jgi:hypothetical protein
MSIIAASWAAVRPEPMSKLGPHSLGQKLTFGHDRRRSVRLSTPDIARLPRHVRFVPQAATVGAIGMLSFEMVVEKLVQAVTCIVRCRAIVFQSVIKNHPAGLELRVIESMVRARINDELDWWPVIAPAGNLVGTVCRRCPIVAGPNENERGYSRTRPRPSTWRIKRSRRPKPQVTWWFEQFERIGLRHR